ncbi:MAG TPA: tannase/feruloyl esterase family alpha/beta hydrolase, partial [Acidobacteriota bacterium]|nr:tannase/feruloyl esterase family alpha/beta hydrolase [Acidobacteriota bacterium]
MMPAIGSFVSAVCIAILVSVLPAAAQQSCESLKSIRIRNVTIASAEKGNPGYELPAQSGFVSMPPQKVQAPFCRIKAYSTPTSGSRIGIEVWLPDRSNWNRRFLALGNPGFIGSIASGGIARNMERGYVSAGTDTGHVDEGFEWAIGHPEKWADWGHRAVHEMAVVTRALANAYYGEPIQYSYWNSCHNGGNQGLNEAQRYPNDFDGIIAEDPAFFVSHLQAGSLYISWVALKDGVDGPGYIPTEKLAVINKAVLAACDANDGLIDGIIEHPPSCAWNPARIQCKGNDRPDCLTAAQVETVRKIYEGAKFKDGAPIYTGFERGSELTWPLMIEKEPFIVNLNYFKGMVFEDAGWDWRTFDVDRDTRLAVRKTADAVDATDPNLKPFKDAGGKLIMVASWNSTALPPRQLVKYYEEVEKTMGGPEQTRDFARLFAVPGSSGCPAFANPEGFKVFEALQAWVEEGKAPDKIIYAHTKGGQVYRTRPVCAYPQQARYKGSGDINDAANFT